MATADGRSADSPPQPSGNGHSSCPRRTPASRILARRSDQTLRGHSRTRVPGNVFLWQWSQLWFNNLKMRYYPHQLSFLIDNPLRRLLISPSQFADRLSLNESSRVLEIGPGSGYFSVEIA